MILVIAEQRDDALNRASWEAVAAARSIGGPVKIVVPGASGAKAAEKLSSADVAEVIALEHVALGVYTPDGFVQALAALVGAEQPAHVICAHTYQARDFIPMLAAREPRGWLLQSVIVNGKDYADLPMRIEPPGYDAIEIVFAPVEPTTLEAQVSGTPGELAGRVVIVFPAGSDYWDSSGYGRRRYAAAVTNEGGQCSFQGLPPGEYFVAAIAGDAARDWQRRAFLLAAAPASMRVTLRAGQAAAVNVTRVISGSPSAKVVLIEFSDYQCPFCSRFVTEVLPALDEK